MWTGWTGRYFSEYRRASTRWLTIPAGVSVKLAGYSQLYRTRVGDWRVVYEINDRKRVVTVTIVAHRRESYRGL